MSVDEVPPPWPAAAYSEDAARIGPALHALITKETRWVHRRVERVDVLGFERVRRSVSVDFTVPARFAEQVKLTHWDDHLVPIAILRKAPLRNFDCRLGGDPVPVLGRSTNSLLANAVLATAAERALVRARRAETATDLPTEAPADLPTNLWSMAPDREDMGHTTLERLREAAANGSADAQIVLDDPRAAFLLRTLASNYLLIAQVREAGHRQIIKFSYDEMLERTTGESPSLAQRLGWEPLVVGIDTPSAARAESYHVEVVVPDEAHVVGAVLLDVTSDAVFGVDDDPDRPAVVASGVPLTASPHLLVGITLERSGFPTVALAIAAVIAVLLAVGASLAPLDPAQAGPSITLLLAGTALFAGLIARQGEHRLMQALYAWPRRVLFAVALAALAAASSLAFDACPMVVRVTWAIAALICSAATVGLGALFLNARPRKGG